MANCTHKPVLTYGPSNFLSVDVGSFIEVLCLKVSKCLGVLLGHSFLPSFGPGKLPNIPGAFDPRNFSSFKKWYPQQRVHTLVPGIREMPWEVPCSYYCCYSILEHTITTLTITYSTLLHYTNFDIKKTTCHAIKMRYNFMISNDFHVLNCPNIPFIFFGEKKRGAALDLH